MQGVKHFYLTDSQYLSCKNEQYTSYSLKNTVILYYYIMFQFMGGMFTFQNKYSAAKTRVSVPSIHRLKNSKSPKNTQNHFDTHFEQTQQNQAFHHFPHHQKSPHTTQKSSQTLIN